MKKLFTIMADFLLVLTSATVLCAYYFTWHRGDAELWRYMAVIHLVAAPIILFTLGVAKWVVSFIRRYNKAAGQLDDQAATQYDEIIAYGDGKLMVLGSAMLIGTVALTKGVSGLPECSVILMILTFSLSILNLARVIHRTLLTKIVKVLTSGYETVNKKILPKFIEAMKEAVKLAEKLYIMHQNKDEQTTAKIIFWHSLEIPLPTFLYAGTCYVTGYPTLGFLLVMVCFIVLSKVKAVMWNAPEMDEIAGIMYNIEKAENVEVGDNNIETKKIQNEDGSQVEHHIEEKDGQVLPPDSVIHNEDEVQEEQNEEGTTKVPETVKNVQVEDNNDEIQEYKNQYGNQVEHHNEEHQEEQDANSMDQNDLLSPDSNQTSADSEESSSLNSASDCSIDESETKMNKESVLLNELESVGLEVTSMNSKSTAGNESVIENSLTSAEFVKDLASDSIQIPVEDEMESVVDSIPSTEKLNGSLPIESDESSDSDRSLQKINTVESDNEYELIGLD